MQVNRREFLQTATAFGAAALTVGSAFNAFGAEIATPVKTGIFVCSICGHIEFGSAPDACPVCHAPHEDFKRNDAVFSDAELKFKDVAVKHVPVVTATKKSRLVTEEPSIAVEVKIGKTIHPMDESHYIRFIDCYIDDKYVSRLLLTLRNHPTAGIDIKTPGSKVRIVEMCNLHGHWQAETTVK